MDKYYYNNSGNLIRKEIIYKSDESMEYRKYDYNEKNQLIEEQAFGTDGIVISRTEFQYKKSNVLAREDEYYYNEDSEEFHAGHVKYKYNKKFDYVDVEYVQSPWGAG